MSDALDKALSLIRPVDKSLFAKAYTRLDDLTKPKGSLGRLEELAARIYAVQEGVRPLKVDPARIYTAAGDHGVAVQGVSLYPQAVTRQMVLNFVTGGAGVNVLAKTAGVELKVVDAGAAGGPFPNHPDLIQAKVAEGTADISKGPAMTIEQCRKALSNGVELALAAKAAGRRTVGLGDMGIANTTPSTALFCAYFGLSPREIAGPGTGLAPGGVEHKIQVIEQALTVNAQAVTSGDPIAILAALGGYEIATLAGLAVGAAAYRLLVVVDGFISTAAYAAAGKIRSDVADYAVLAHQSAEPGYAKVIEALGESPLLDLGMRLGEGTGSALAIFLMRSAVNIFNDMADFSSAGVSTAGADH